MGKTLGELLGWPGPMTHLEFLVWHRWLTDRWNDPDLQCHYLMQVGAEIRATRQMFTKSPRSVRIDELKLKFSTREDAKDRTITEAEAKIIEAQWLAKLGVLGGGQLQGNRAPIRKREPGPEHDARNAGRQRGPTPNAGKVPTPKGRRVGAGPGRANEAPQPVGKRMGKPPVPTLPRHMRNAD